MYRIRKIELTSGIDIAPGDLTVAIGPNNGGKSQFLKDLVSSIALPTNPRKSIKAISTVFPEGSASALKTIAEVLEYDENGHAILDVPSPDFHQPQQLRVMKQALDSVMEGGSDDTNRARFIENNLGRHLVSHLTTERRLLLIKRQVNRPQNIERHQSPIESAFAATPETLSWIDERVQAAFGTKLVLDGTLFAAAEFRLGNTDALNSDRGQRQKEIRALPQLDDQGDGIRSFCGILVAMTASLRPVIAVDEPEAFLHPPQAYLIGRALAELRNRGVQIFIATHSADVLRGILSVTVDATIVRFSKIRSSFATKVLNPVELLNITNAPVLSSARVLDGLFYSGVAVTESDGDVVLYRNLLQELDSSASIGFVNSYSKQLSAKIAMPFRAMGVPCAVMVDFDVLRVRSEFKKIFKALDGDWLTIEAEYDSLIKEIEGSDTADSRLRSALSLVKQARKKLHRQGDARQQLVWLRARLKDIRESASVWGELKKRGARGLTASANPSYDFIIEKCECIGLFIVSAGEREAWLIPEVPYTTDKPKWTESALRYLARNSLPETHPLRKYVRSVWRFCLENS